MIMLMPGSFNTDSLEQEGMMQERHFHHEEGEAGG
jgi:hypothetical protein